MAEYIEQCKKCFHLQVCAQVMKNQLKIRNIMLKEENPECEHFVNAADVAEVVRCKDCAIPHNRFTGCPKLNGLIPPGNHFCGYGERKEGEDKMTSEYIVKQHTFEVRSESLKERTEKFFSTYENPSGSEDRIEICLIREGYRAVLLAEEEINRLKEENAKLQTSIGLTSDKYRIGRIKAEAYKEFKHTVKTYFRLTFLRRKRYEKIFDEVETDLLREMEGDGK